MWIKHCGYYRCVTSSEKWPLRRPLIARTGTKFFFSGNWSVTVKTPSRSFGTWQRVSGPGHSPRPRGLYRSTKPKLSNGIEISRRGFRNCWICEMRTIQAKILEIPGEKLNGKKTSKKTFPTIWVNLARLPSFFRNFRKCCYIRYWKLPKIQTGYFGWMENAP